MSEEYTVSLSFLVLYASVMFLEVFFVVVVFFFSFGETKQSKMHLRFSFAFLYKNRMVLFIDLTFTV